ncbi:phosphatase PAP2 family protein [Gordonia otitidis]|uniref:phosphatase PAP2 family protein n=1 Tax=Gordonia otitidis TaxID=249058 RepID=UPI0002DE65DC|nr:phosphatase PAP2 family protein [Gordonia otitidis]UEA60124.1 phosphatase PAP2 family protein [Gordonia otitidis]
MIVQITDVDQHITEWVVDHRVEPLTTIVRIVTVLGNTVTLWLVATVVVVVLAARRHVTEAVYVGVGALTGSLLMVILKHIFARARPPRDDRLLHIESYSFPSGHSMMTMVVYGLIAVAAYRLIPWVRAHPWSMALAPVISILVGLTRIYLGVHWTTDVLAGWIIGALWVGLCTWVLSLWLSRA